MAMQVSYCFLLELAGFVGKYSELQPGKGSAAGGEEAGGEEGSVLLAF